MYALKPPTPTQQPKQVNRVARKAKPRKSSHPYRAIAYETTAKLMVNVVLSVAAVTALAQLLPYRATQVGKIQELDAALKSTGERVQGVQNRFQNFFDPYQARENMQELTDRIDPNRRRIIWKSAPVITPPQSTANTEIPIQEP
ncbi:MAG: hypothetical protein NW220_05695 [Leptolyngbyaceae cyanobacterium bins.349]|nr:hypothetical protein [Leptolyngbyaceae cyanobacterium bins.349]